MRSKNLSVLWSATISQDVQIGEFNQAIWSLQNKFYSNDLNLEVVSTIRKKLNIQNWRFETKIIANISWFHRKTYLVLNGESLIIQLLRKNILLYWRGLKKTEEIFRQIFFRGMKFWNNHWFQIRWTAFSRINAHNSSFR